MTRIRTKQLYKRQDGATSVVVKRSIIIAGHKTSVSMEDAFWRALTNYQAGQNKELGLKKGEYGYVTLGKIVADIDVSKPNGANLSCAIRLFILNLMQQEIQLLSETLSAVMQKKAA